MIHHQGCSGVIEIVCLTRDILQLPSSFLSNLTSKQKLLRLISARRKGETTEGEEVTVHLMRDLIKNISFLTVLFVA